MKQELKTKKEKNKLRFIDHDENYKRIERVKVEDNVVIQQKRRKDKIIQKHSEVKRNIESENKQAEKLQSQRE